MPEYIYNVPNALRITSTLACHVIAPYEANAYLGNKIVELTNVALSRQLETDMGADGYTYDPVMRRGLPKKTIAQAFDPTNERLSTQIGRRIATAIKPDDDEHPHGNGVCTIVLDNSNVLAAALVTHTPHSVVSGKVESHRQDDLRIEAVLSRSPRKYLGSIALYTALKMVDSSPEDRIIFDGLKRNGTNKWFRELGFAPVEPAETVSPLVIGDLRLPRTRYALHADATKQTILSRIATKRPWLTRGQVIEDC